MRRPETGDDEQYMHILRRASAVLLLVVGPLAVAAPAAAGACDVPGVIADCPPSEPEPEPDPEAAPPAQPTPSEPAATAAPDPAAAARRLLELANTDRAAAGAPALRMRGDVVSIAADHSRAMAARGDIWHNDAYFTAATRKHLGAKSLAENVALNTDADGAHRRLMASAGHRANLLNARFTVVGMAVAVDRNGRIYVTQNFVEPATTAAVAPVAAIKAASAGAPRSAAPASPATTPGPATTVPVQQSEVGDTTESPAALATTAPSMSLDPVEEVNRRADSRPARPVAPALLALLLLVGTGVLAMRSAGVVGRLGHAASARQEPSLRPAL